MHGTHKVCKDFDGGAPRRPPQQTPDLQPLGRFPSEHWRYWARLCKSKRDCDDANRLGYQVLLGFVVAPGEDKPLAGSWAEVQGCLEH